MLAVAESMKAYLSPISFTSIYCSMYNNADRNGPTKPSFPITSVSRTGINNSLSLSPLGFFAFAHSSTCTGEYIYIQTSVESFTV